MKNTYKISGMTCQGCRNHVEQALQSVDGVKSVSVSLENAEAEIAIDGHVPVEKMQKALADDGGHYGIFVDGHAHQHTSASGSRHFKRSGNQPINITVPCTRKSCAISLEAAPFAGWTWSRWPFLKMPTRKKNGQPGRPDLAQG